MGSRAHPKTEFEKGARASAEQERDIQRNIDQRDAEHPAAKESKSPMQAGQREYPAKFSAQHLEKPGHEADLDAPPMFEAPAYKGSEKLAGRVALITGGDSGIGRAVAVLYAREGADVAIVYLDEDEDATRGRPESLGSGAPS